MLTSPIFIQALLVWNKVLASWITAIILTSIATFYALTPTRHPLIPLSTDVVEVSPSILFLSRQELYFSAARRDIREPYFRAIDALALSTCKTVGLAIRNDDWEYPLWVLLQKKGETRIIHANVTNASKNARRDISEDQLCAVIATDENYSDIRNTQEEFQKGWVYQPISQKPFVAVYLKEDKSTSIDHRKDLAL